MQCTATAPTGSSMRSTWSRSQTPNTTKKPASSAYAGFAMLPEYIEEGNDPVVVSGDTPVAEAIPVKKVPAFEEGTPNNLIPSCYIEYSAQKSQNVLTFIPHPEGRQNLLHRLKRICFQKYRWIS